MYEKSVQIDSHKGMPVTKIKSAIDVFNFEGP